ncbi:MAG: fatty acid desaturase [Alcanivoracaceae bacterium]|nr:fatty acid desaturase [Alcanivoracaceae bacterium]
MKDKLYVFSAQLNAVKVIHAVILVIGMPVIIALALAYDLILPIHPAALAVLVVFYMLTFWGITVGYHRLISHKAFQVTGWAEVMLGILGSMAMQGPVFYWVANHRRHHRYADKENDPHSPVVTEGGHLLGRLKGFFYSHLVWIFSHKVSNPMLFCKDLVKNPRLRFVSSTYKLWAFLGLVIPPVIDYAITRDSRSAFSTFMYFGPIRIFFSYHITSCINSVCHLVGYRNYSSADNSRNVYSLSLVSLGESLHNNHHRMPASAKFSHRWFEVDLGYAFIRAMELLGIARNVNVLTSEKA